MGKIKGFFHKKIIIPVFLLLGAVAFLVPYGIKTASAKSNNRKLPIYCVGTEEKKVALSFDAAWGNEDTKEILEIQSEHNYANSTDQTWVISNGR